MSQMDLLAELSPLTVRPSRPLSDDELFALCARYPRLRIERSAQGDLIIMPPTGAETGKRNAELLTELTLWARVHGGVVFDSSTGFVLPNGAERSPDAAWIPTPRWEGLTSAQRERFAPLCPDFVVELRSPGDRLRELQDKLQEYIDNGARLGWLIDPVARRVLVYRADGSVSALEDPPSVSGEDVLPGFELRLALLL